MAGSLSNCSESHLLLLFFSARTTLIRFSNLRFMLYVFYPHTYKDKNYLKNIFD